MNQNSHGSDDDIASDASQDDVREAVVQDTWKTMFQSTEHLLFGTRQTPYNLSTLHPDQFQIFRLWQIYLDHIDPLLKVTHTPSMQGRIIDSAQDLTRTTPETEALMFSIYCVSVHSLHEDDCLATFGAARRDLLVRFQFGCQQALSNCDFLRSNDLECLTAIYLYLLSARQETDPRSLSALLGIAVRIAQRMGLHIESKNVACTAFKAELRRRVWWALVLFDARISEMADHKTSILSPTWDCKTPANMNDFAIGPEIKQHPMTHGFPTESIFTVVRSELADFTRHCAFHLDFTTPALKLIVREASTSPDLADDDLNALEERIQEKYLKFCNPENALQFMTIWTARSILSKNRLLQHYSRYSRTGSQQTDEQRDMAVSYTLTMLESDTTIAKNPLVKGYLWLVNSYFPFPAYIHLVQDLRRRPRAKHVEQCWQSMNENYSSRFATLDEQNNPFFRILGKQVLQAWVAYEDACKDSGSVPDRLQIIKDIERRGIKLPATPKDPGSTSAGTSVGTRADGANISATMGFGSDGVLFPDLPQQAFMDVDMDLFDWTAVDWGKL
ncbi:fungal specific transcription factor domain-containing protein 25 [Elsinoe australis]|uniref:Fungal specific transcription factor domain-containing protein 25 n=1 Tax=Elsinoe australis TaxID=40998 RepID=A0A4U7B4F3_9PEZI|nr:fungal specific transcription factor domain-containing protein 25 [Elsinoe australis]